MDEMPSQCGEINVSFCFLLLKHSVDACLTGSVEYIFLGLFGDKGFPARITVFPVFPPSLCQTTTILMAGH